MMTEKISIPEVTVIAIDCTDRIKDTVRVLKKTKEQIDFGEIILLANRKPRNLPEFITYKRIKKIEDINQYNRFMFLELHKYFDASHCLTVQDHAYILHPELWDDEWLQYDYIGAPWLYQQDSYITTTGEHVRVGNGGFSLRSKKLCELPVNLGWELRQDRGFYNEDGNICVYWRYEMLEQGIKYAPIEVASKFSYENLMQENYRVMPFGFHRNFPIATWSQNETEI